MTMPLLVSAVEQVLNQGKALLANTEASNYSLKLGEPFKASIGQHYRHVLDHFLCFFGGLESGIIDYDHRGRSRELESDLAQALAKTNELIAVAKFLPAMMLRGECSVRYTVGYGDQRPIVIASTVERELAFCISHSVHHYAIIRLLCAQQQLIVPAEFGIAPATLKFRAAQMAN